MKLIRLRLARIHQSLLSTAETSNRNYTINRRAGRLKFGIGVVIRDNVPSLLKLNAWAGGHFIRLLTAP